MVKVLGTVSGSVGTGALRDPVSTSPTANPDFRETVAGGPSITLNLTGNDLDPSGGGLIVIEASIDSASEADGASISISSGGTQVTFTPPDNPRTTTGTYTVRDSNDLTSTSSFEVDVLAAPDAGDIEVSITSNRTEDTAGRILATAPGGMIFMAESTGTPEGIANYEAYKDLHYTWDFGDPGYYTRHDTDDYPWDRVYDDGGTIKICRGDEVWTQDGTKLGETAVLGSDGYEPASGTATFLGNDSNIAYGPWVAHVFSHERDFGGQDYLDITVRCHVRLTASSLPLLTATKTVRLRNPDVVFAGAATILVSESGNRSNASDPEWEPSKYPGAQRCNTLDQATAAHNSRPNPSNIRILLKRGDDFSGEQLTGFASRRTKYHIGSYGTGNPPILSENPIETEFPEPSSAFDETELALFGLDVIGPYDPENPNALTGDLFDLGGLYVGGGKAKTIWDCKVTGMWGCIQGSSNQVSDYGPGYQNLIIGNTFVGDWADYGLFSNKSPSFHGQCGVWVKQARNTVRGDSRNTSISPPLYARHGPLRCNSPGSPTVFCLVDYRSIGGWSAGFQPCNRWMFKPVQGGGYNPGGWPDPAVLPFYNWDRARFEGGRGPSQVFSSASSSQVGDGVLYPVKGIYDKVYTIGYSQVPGFIAISGMVVRNIIAMVVDQENYAGGAASNVLSLKTDADTDYLPVDDRYMDLGLEAYNLTLVDYRSYSVGGWDSFTGVSGSISGYAYTYISNNLEHAPYRPDLSADENLDESTLWHIDYPGLRDSSDGAPYTPDTTYVIDHDAPIFRPLSPVAATGKFAIDDFFGRLRTDPHQGAVEP